MVNDAALRALFDACDLTAIGGDIEAAQTLFEFFIMTHTRGRLKDKLKVYVREEKEREANRLRQKRKLLKSRRKKGGKKRSRRRVPDNAATRDRAPSRRAAHTPNNNKTTARV